MKKRYYVFLIIIAIIIIFGIIFILNTNKNSNNNSNSTNNTYEENNVENQTVESNTIDTESAENTLINKVVETSPEEVENMKNTINATGKTDIYQVEEEKGGRKILQIKPQVQFYVDLAGIIKGKIPKENELEDLVKKAPTDNGIWISTNSREDFSKILNNNGIKNFAINDNGYLKINNPSNDLEKNLLKMINSNKLYIINITGIAFERDYVTGEIVEYPFEDMDPEQVLESYKDENKIILEITTNKKQKVTDKEILEAIAQY